VQLQQPVEYREERSRFGGTIAARNQRFILLCLLPASLALLAVIAYPLFYGFFLSLTDANPLSLEQEFIGFTNYRDILGDSVYQNSLWLTIRFTAVIIAIEFPLAMILALLLNEPIRGRAIYRAMLLIPWVMPNVVAAIIWGWLYSPDFGLLNFALAELRLIDTYLSFTGDPNRALPAVIAVSVWKGLPFSTVVLLAGLQAVPADLYEAARVDGANAWQRFRDITVPGMLPIIVIVLVLRAVWSFNSFDLVYVLTGGGPGWATQLLSIYVYLTSFQYQQLGYGAAMAVTMLVVLAIPVAIFVRRTLPREA
ncbi:MAG: sugar ABC transporter permease, partial [Chloroflexia bacterium]|nr:sugar ABC transporter permease [Chloroflexia bacterium]